MLGAIPIEIRDTVTPPSQSEFAGLLVGLEVDGLVGSDGTVLGIGLSLEALLKRLPAPLP